MSNIKNRAQDVSILCDPQIHEEQICFPDWKQDLNKNVF